MHLCTYVCMYIYTQRETHRRASPLHASWSKSLGPVGNNAVALLGRGISYPLQALSGLRAPFKQSKCCWSPGNLTGVFLLLGVIHKHMFAPGARTHLMHAWGPLLVDIANEGIRCVYGNSCRLFFLSLSCSLGSVTIGSTRSQEPGLSVGERPKRFSPSALP